VFESTTQSLVLDHFRVPYHIGGDAITIRREGRASCGLHRLRPTGTTQKCLVWPAVRSYEVADARGAHSIGSIPIFGCVVAEGDISALLGEVGRNWRPVWPVRSRNGTVAHICRDDSGSLYLPFDPNEVIWNYLTENYRSFLGWPAGSAALASVRRSYYRFRPLMPRRIQIILRRQFARVQRRRWFPRWPVETALTDFQALILSMAVDVADVDVPWIAPWPAPYEWAIVLTHDVETAVGLARVEEIARLEADAGFRSSWNLVPRRYTTDPALVDRLHAQGFEVGIHGLFHDGRDLGSAESLRERLPEMLEYARRWRALGFRSPGTQRSWDLIGLLPFAYDSSYPDTDPFEPQAGGSCSLLPYHNADVVELPITLPQDHTLFVILGHNDERVWVQKLAHVRSRGGMGLMLTHPDYMHDPRIVAAYRRILARCSSDETVWRALPRDVSSWWVARGASRLVQVRGAWQIIGPGASRGAVRTTRRQDVAEPWGLSGPTR
jgi:hypothetical protein